MGTIGSYVCYLSINDVGVGSISSGQSDHWDITDIMVPVKKGDIIKCKNNLKSPNLNYETQFHLSPIQFYPNKK